VWRNFGQKERNNRNTFFEIIVDMGKYFPCKWGKNRIFQEIFQKNPPEVTPIFFWNLTTNMCRHSVQNSKILKIRYLRYRPMSESRFFKKKIEVMFKKDDEDKLLMNSFDQKWKERIFSHKKTFWSG
jgi:hypothetical protein